MNDLSKACIDEANNSMHSAINFLNKELEKIRAGKANPGMLEGVKIDYYGTPTEISQVANINTPDPALGENHHWCHQQSHLGCQFGIHSAPRG